MKKLLVFMLMLCTFLVGCKENGPLEIQGEERLEIGFSYEYVVKYNGIEISFDELYFNVSNLDICEVKGNTLYALDSGFITITAALKDDPTVYISKQLEIIEPLVSDIKLKGDKTVKEGEQILLEAIVTPEDTTIPVIWESSDPSIATVDEGIITGVKGGIVIISAKCSSAKAEFTVEVIEIIREIKVEGKNEIEVNSTQRYDFNIDDPIITTDSTNIVLMGNYVYAIETGKAVLHIVSESNPNLELDYEINVVSEYDNTIEMTEEERDEINSIMESLSVEQKLGQMIILNVRGNSLQLGDDGLFFTTASNGSTIKSHYLSEMISFPVGNILVSYDNSTNKNSVKNYIAGMQDIILDDAGIGAIVLSDRSGNVSEPLTNGFTKNIDNILFGTANDENLLEEYYNVIGNEMNITGINTLVYSGYTKSSNVTGNFSNINSKQLTYSSIVRNVLKQNKVNTGSYYGYYDIENDFESNEFLLKTAINDGLDFLLTYNSMNFYWNRYVTIPTYVRELGYQGLIMPSVSDYNIMVNNNNGLNVPTMEYCIENGYDLIPLNIYTSSYQLEDNVYTISAFNQTVEKINNGEIDINIVNAAVERILLYKIRNGLLNGTYPNDKEFNPNTEMLTEATNSLKFISVKGEFEGLSKEKRIHVFSTRPSSGGWRDRVYYDLADVMHQNAFTYGYKEVVPYVFNGETYLSQIEQIQSGDQVVIGMYEMEMWYEVIKEDGEYWYSTTWQEIIDLIKEKTDDIVVVNMESPNLTRPLEEYGYPIIYMNGNYDSKFKPLLNCLNSGKSNGVLYFE